MEGGGGDFEDGVESPCCVTEEPVAVFEGAAGRLDMEGTLGRYCAQIKERVEVGGSDWSV